jgi:hypothetical protein
VEEDQYVAGQRVHLQKATFRKNDEDEGKKGEIALTSTRE